MSPLFGLYTAGGLLVLLAVALAWFSRERLVGVARSYEANQLEYDRWERQMPEAARYHDLAARVADLEAEHAELQADAQEARRVVEDKDLAQEQLDRARSELLELEPRREELERLKLARDAAAEGVREAEADQRTAREEAAAARLDAERTRQERDGLREEAQRLSERKGQLEDACASLKSQEAEAAAKLAGSTAALGDAADGLARLKAQGDEVAAELKQDREALRVVQEEGRAAEAALAEAQRALASVQKEVGTLQETQARLEKAVAALREQEAGLAAGLAGAQSRLEAVQADIAERRTQREALEREVERLAGRRDQLTAEAQDAQSRLSAATREAEELERKKARTQRWLDENAIAGIGAGVDAAADLWTPALVLGDGKRRQEHETEAEALDAVARRLKGLGLVFPERVVHALHTSFKVAEESPLTVLAGISGTGKSELPRRYAEAMGMHFLPVAVQPRWDSPQDLFGFYNYLEKRFRPTELTRALLQMDRFDKRADRGWSGHEEGGFVSYDEEMLVVLLDEMNLARVEYYFSELLSKLETRRGLDEAHEDARRAAELTLELGLDAGGTGGNDKERVSPQLRFLVDTNVLFVGTMNEDESTQTLSDKVVDRANLMRFGKPRDLTKPAERPPGGRDVGVPSLAYATWRGWLREPDALGGSAGQIDDWTQRLNDKLAGVQRPFGHRMARAIRAYAANYPRVDVGEEEAVKLAFADQVEMRVLPRLRGVELGEPASRELFSELGILCEKDLGDEALAEEIRRCAKPENAQFSWVGLEREPE